jgi:hypothetical protein
MPKLSKKERDLIVYGNEKQTIPILMPNSRYRALKSLALHLDRPLNRLVRDLIEEAYGKELDEEEQRNNAPSDMQESTTTSFKAHARWAS